MNADAKKLGRAALKLEEKAAAAGGRDPFRRRNRQLLLACAGFALLAWASSAVTEFNLADGFAALPRVAAWVGANLQVGADTWAALPRILGKLGETVLISVMATVVAAVLAFALAVFGNRVTRPHPALSWLCRLVASFFRNVPVVAWALVFLFAFGQSSFTGFLAIFIETFGFLARSFMEAIEENADSGVEALRASGAGYWPVVFQAVVPAVLPMLVSWMLYMVESNIRSATLVGILTGSGIGFLFDLYYKTMDYSAAALVVLSIIVVVLAIEALSNRIRRIIL